MSNRDTGRSLHHVPVTSSKQTSEGVRLFEVVCDGCTGVGQGPSTYQLFNCRIFYQLEHSSLKGNLYGYKSSFLLYISFHLENVTHLNGDKTKVTLIKYSTRTKYLNFIVVINNYFRLLVLPGIKLYFCRLKSKDDMVKYRKLQPDQ